MPANLSADFLKAEAKYRSATTPGERLVCLEEMFTTLPKHKGTEKMQADIKTRISKLKKEMASPSKGGAKRSDWFHVEKQGAGQTAVIGAPNCGKSALVSQLTGLRTEIAAYPFTTTAPAAGMMQFEDVQVQLIDTPPVSPDAAPWLYHIMRTADIILWLIDLSDDALLESFEQTQQLLKTNRIIREVGTDTTTTEEAADDAETPVVADAPLGLIKKALFIGTKCDDQGAQDRLTILREVVGDIPLLLTSVESGSGLEELRRRLFEMLNIIRVYTKRPGKTADMNDPVVLAAGSTVMDAAYHLHKDFAQSLQFARLWNASGLDGQRVDRGHVLADHDVIEFHV
jgi:uncharacterized protein